MCFNFRMERIQRGESEIAYHSIGSGPPLVLLHPFPVHHEFWLPAAEPLAARYRVILPDLRGHGESGAGTGAATMRKHADDLERVMVNAGVAKAPMVGVSIGGYILFEFWRTHKARVQALGLINTKAGADNAEARANRLKAASEALERGTEPFFTALVQKLVSRTTRERRPDLVEGALKMMRKMSAASLAAVQRGMAERPDSMDTLQTINVPTLIVTGAEDEMTGVNEAELMRREIASSEMKVVPHAGHYSPWERPKEVAGLLREWLGKLS